MNFLLTVLCFVTFSFTSIFGFEEKPLKNEEKAQVIILGGGIGALTAALYLSRAGLKPLIIQGNNPGGLIAQSHSVQNWPGELEIEGASLITKVRQQVIATGAEFLNEEVVNVDFSVRPFIIQTKSMTLNPEIRTLRADSCIIAMGTKPNFLNIPGESLYWGKGVSNCAICDGSLYKDQVVGIVGGGDAAVLESLYLSNLAKDVYVFVRKDHFKAKEKNRLSTLQNKSNIHVLFETEVTEILGNSNEVVAVALNKKGRNEQLPLNALFLAIGSTPNSEVFKNHLKLDSKGYIVLDKDQQTSVEGIYALGDIVDPIYKQAISAAGDAAKAAIQSQQFLGDRLQEFSSPKIAFNPLKKMKKSSMTEIISQEQFKTALESDLPVFVDFYATWCGPCKRIAPMLEKASQELEDKAVFLKVNIDDMPELSKTYQIRSIPTVLCFEKGKLKDRKVGSEEIMTLLKDLKKG